VAAAPQFADALGGYDCDRRSTQKLRDPLGQLLGSLPLVVHGHAADDDIEAAPLLPGLLGRCSHQLLELRALSAGALTDGRREPLVQLLQVGKPRAEAGEFLSMLTDGRLDVGEAAGDGDARLLVAAK